MISLITPSCLTWKQSFMPLNPLKVFFCDIKYLWLNKQQWQMKHPCPGKGNIVNKSTGRRYELNYILTLSPNKWIISKIILLHKHYNLLSTCVSGRKGDHYHRMMTVNASQQNVVHPLSSGLILTWSMWHSDLYLDSLFFFLQADLTWKYWHLFKKWICVYETWTIITYEWQTTCLPLQVSFS